VVAGLVLAAASAIAHDLYVGVYHGGETVPPQQQVRAARIATVVVGAMAIAIGIAAKGQNVAHLVALAFAVAASANFPCILLTLYWRRCSTGGIVAGMVVGTVVAVGLTLVSPNVTYPKAVRAAARQVLDGELARRATLETTLASSDAHVVESARFELAALDKAVAKAREDLKNFDGRERSLVGLEKPLFTLKNPGIVSIPLGFLAVLLGSLLFRDPRSEALWPEVYARQNTGILASRAVVH
jgi:cation/acetate symporter